MNSACERVSNEPQMESVNSAGNCASFQYVPADRACGLYVAALRTDSYAGSSAESSPFSTINSQALEPKMYQLWR